MAYPSKFHEKAHFDYIEAYEWYELKQPGLGDKFMEATEKQLMRVSEHPEYFSHVYKNFRHAKIQGFPYIIVYEFFPKRKLSHVAAIHHSKRNPKHKFRREIKN